MLKKSLGPEPAPLSLPGCNPLPPPPARIGLSQLSPESVCFLMRLGKRMKARGGGEVVDFGAGELMIRQSQYSPPGSVAEPLPARSFPLKGVPDLAGSRGSWPHQNQ